MRLELDGSSPLARGKLRGLEPHTVTRGFIPTRAGKMESGSGYFVGYAVHPHSRGENVSMKLISPSGHGSSPLARGKFGPTELVDLSGGFIPTRAGKIQGHSSATLHTSVHPHSRGENPQYVQYQTCQAGSSPLARGKWSLAILSIHADRFIPTRAGKINGRLDEDPTPEVHPHSRGENLLT